MPKIITYHVDDTPGTLKDFAGTTVPAHYLACDGSTVSQTTYKALFAAIGTAFNTGGEPAGTFRLPDSRRKTHVGAGGTVAYTGTGSVGNAVGNSGGRESWALATTEIPDHAHTVVVTGTSGLYQYLNPQRSFSGGTGNRQRGFGSGTPFGTRNAAPVTVSVSSAGTGGAHNNMQPSLAVTQIIKY